MNFPIIREYQPDLRNDNPENEVRKEPFSVEAGIWTRVIVPVHSPFFVESLRLYFPNGEPMIYGVHYRMFRLMAGLCKLTGAKVGCMIELLDLSITEGLIDYDIVGEFTLFDTTMMNLIMAAANDDRPVYWENLKNKPVVFPPEWHQHSILLDIVAWQDMIHLLDLIMAACDAHGRPLIEVKVDHYFDLFNHYLKVYGDMLKKYLASHKAAYNEHGLTDVQVGLELVDNYPTAAGSQALEPRDDMHLTVSGLKAIIENYGFDPNDYMKAGSLPIGAFGNTNFIPPSIAGSFEGLGGMSETAGICMESDGSLVFLENRMDGRINALYYSVVKTPYDNPRRLYTSYRYTHQRVEADNAIVNRIAQGSGGEVILMVDSVKGFGYIGLTNGSLDPAKHVLSRIDLSACKAHYPNPAGIDLGELMSVTNVQLIGDWIYIFVASAYANGALPAGSIGDIRFRYIFRVPKATVAAQLPVTATRVNTSYQDGDGVQWNNAPYWRWCTPQGNGPYFSKWYHTIKADQVGEAYVQGNYRSQQTLVCPIPNKPGKFLLRFTSAWWSRYIVPGYTGGYELMLEMLYEFDPTTNVMTLLKKTPQYTIDYRNPPPVGAAFASLVFLDREQGLEVLADGTIVASSGSYQSFPRGFVMYKSRNHNSRYETMAQQWNTQLGPFDIARSWWEDILSPLESGVKPRSFMLGNGGDFYTADNNTQTMANRLYYRQSAGKLAVRSDVQNIYYPNPRSRPLSNKVWEVRTSPIVGGASVTVPAAQLDAFGTDLGESTFCVNVQKKYIDLQPWVNSEWPIPANPDDVMLITGHTTRVATDGKLEIVPTSTILYPEAIVNLLKREVADVAAMLACPKVIVTICDPTGFLTNRFGWLPVLVMVNYAKVGTTDRYVSMLSITPTYSGAVNRVVTGYTVLDRLHYMYPDGAAALTPTSWDAYLSGGGNSGTHGAMRVGYHVNGNEVRGFFDSGVAASGPGDSLQTFGLFVYPNKTTRRWSTDGNTAVSITGQSGAGGHKCVLPDQGVVTAIAHSISTGGAATLFQGGSYNAILGSVYPEVGWSVFFQVPIDVTFNGKHYVLPEGMIDLRDVEANPANKTFYIYAVLQNGVPEYQVTQEKRLESPWQLWAARVVTNDRQILTIERFNVFTINGNRISELKRGNAIPASSGLANAEGQLPWLRSDELLP